MAKRPQRKAVRQPRLRDPANPDERAMLQELETFRSRMMHAWLLERKFEVDFSDVAREARVSPKTVERFVLGASQQPYITTVIRIAAAVGYRLTLVNRNAAQQRNEVAPDLKAGEKLGQQYREKVPAKKLRRKK